jgi:sugar phosphate isomerase/epimerase
MTQDEIIEMARQTGCPMANMMPMYFTDTQLLIMLKAFAKLVAEKEREACAKVCEEYETNNDIADTWLNIVSEVIRARGQA